MARRAGNGWTVAVATLGLGGWLFGCGTAVDAPVRPGANVLLVTLDTTRADHIGVYGSAKTATPNLDALAHDGVRFARAVSSVPLTLPAHTSMFTGVYPSSHGVRDNGGFALSRDRKTLAEVIRSAGYVTHAVVGAFVVHGATGLGRGFDGFEDDFDAAPTEAADALHVQRDGAEVADRGIRWLTQHAGERFFLWLHFYDPHYPYEPKGEFAIRYRDDPYSGEVAYTDAQIGRVLAELKSLGLYDKTLIVAVGDHGEGLEDHGEPQHGIFLYQPTVHVPLIVRAPEKAYRGVVDAVARDVDLMPTILAYTGTPVPPRLAGASFLPLMAGMAEKPGRLAYSETFYPRFHFGWSELRSIQGARYKYVEAPRPELYDLDQDPGETRNLVETEASVAADLRQALDEIESATPDGGGEAEEQPVDAETMAKLAALGYVGGRAPERSGKLADPKDKIEALNLILSAMGDNLVDLRNGNHRAIIDRLEKILRTEPDYVEGYAMLAQAYRKIGRADQAIRVLGAAMKISPDSEPIQQALAEAYAEGKDHDAAGAILTRMIASWPKHPSAYFILADVLADQGRHDEAVARLGQVLQFAPDNGRAHYEIGRLLLRRGRTQQAAEEIRRAVELSPKLPGAHYNLALIAEESGRPADAVAEYEKELALFPKNYEALVNLGVLRLDRGERDAAADLFRKVVAVRPELFAGRYLLAKALFEGGVASDEALEQARNAVRIDPNSERARALLAAIQRARGGS